MNVGTVLKDPTEEFPISVDFAAELDDGETVLTPTVLATLKTSGAPAPEVLEGPPAVLLPAATAIGQKVTGGTDGTTYVLAYMATTTAGNIYTGKVALTVKANYQPS
jgi:hypothetical protein